MALLDRLLKRPASGNINNNAGTCKAKNSSFCTKNADGRFALDSDGVRVVVFRDHDGSGRRLLYDSTRCNARKVAEDQLLGELMFGNQVMVKKAKSTIKVHQLKSPQQLMIAKVFIPSTSNSGSDCFRTCEMFDLYCFQDLPQDDLLASSSSLPVPVKEELTKSYDACSKSSDAHSRSSFNKWWQLKNTYEDTSTENSLTSSLAIPSSESPRSGSLKPSQSPKRAGCPKSTENFCVQAIPLRQRPMKLGIGIVFALPENESSALFMKRFFFSHVVILENYILKLREVLDSPLFLEKLKKCKPELWHRLFEETTGPLVQSLKNFYSFPRLASPLWLTLSVSALHSTFSARIQFMKDFILLTEKCYTRHTKFFLGSLITAVLTHHLSWASSRISFTDTKHTAQLPISNNPLQAQLRDLYGAVGFPCCISKTVIVGKKSDLVKKILSVLSYFICCNDLYETPERPGPPCSRQPSSTNESEASKDSGFCESETEDLRKSRLQNCQRPPVGVNRCKLNGFVREPSSKFYVKLPATTNSGEECSASYKSSFLPPKTSLSNVDFKSGRRIEICASSGRSRRVEYESMTGVSCPTSFLLHENIPNEIDELENNFFSIVPTPGKPLRAACPRESSDRVEPVNCSLTQQTVSEMTSTESSKLLKEEPLNEINKSSEISASLSNNSFEATLTIEQNRSQTKSLYNFDLEETLYELMLDLFDNEPKKESSSCCGSTIEDKPYVSQDSKEECTEDQSSNCVLNVNDLKLIPDGSLRDQLLFKLDLIGTASSFEEDAEVSVSSDCLIVPSKTMSNIKQLKSLPIQLSVNKTRDDLSSFSIEGSFLSSLSDRGDQSLDKFLSTSHLLLEDCNLGRSLLGGYCSEYTPEFVLHGTSDRSFLLPPYVDLHRDLKTSLKSSVLEEPADAAQCIVADMDTWSVQLFSLRSVSPDEALNQQTIISSQLVLKLIESVSELSKFNSSPHIWLSIVEDQLSNIYMKSKVLAEFIQGHGQLCSRQLARLLGFDVSDLPLLLAVAGIHSPRILLSLNTSSSE